MKASIPYPHCVQAIDYFNRWRRGEHNDQPDSITTGVQIDELLHIARRQHTALNCLRAAGLPPPLANIVHQALGKTCHE